MKTYVCSCYKQQYWSKEIQVMETEVTLKNIKHNEM